MLQIAVCGKPNVGKSSFFNSATASAVEMANYPFTTIDANKAVAKAGGSAAKAAKESIEECKNSSLWKLL